MKTRHIIITVLIVAFVGGGLWYFTPPAVAPRETTKVAAATQPVAASAPALQPHPATGIAAPVAPPLGAPVTALVATSSPAAITTPAPVDPQENLDTSIDDLISLFRAGDLVFLADKYTTAEELNSLSPAQKASRLQGLQNIMSLPNWPQRIQADCAMIESVKGQVPAMNATGDKATYQMKVPFTPGQNNAFIPLIFTKVDGKWYVTGGGQAF